MSDWLIDVLRETDSAPSAVAPTAYGQQSVVQRRKTKAVEPFTDEGATAYGSERISTAYGLSGEALKAWDGNAEFAELVCALAGLRFKPDLKQQLVLDDVTLTLELWLDDRSLYILMVRAAGPTRLRGRVCRWPKSSQPSLRERFGAGIRRSWRVTSGVRWWRRR